MPRIEFLLEVVFQEFPFVFVFTPKVNRVAQFVVVVVMRGPQNGLITLLQRTLRRFFESLRRAAFGYLNARGGWGRRHIRGHKVPPAPPHAPPATRPHPARLPRES